VYELTHEKMGTANETNQSVRIKKVIDNQEVEKEIITKKNNSDKYLNISNVK
jgi:hypothetical protein